MELSPSWEATSCVATGFQNNKLSIEIHRGRYVAIQVIKYKQSFGNVESLPKVSEKEWTVVIAQKYKRFNKLPVDVILCLLIAWMAAEWVGTSWSFDL
jgi:hypothetical protein